MAAGEGEDPSVQRRIRREHTMHPQQLEARRGNERR
jgi:hypothetical protein